MQITNYTNSLKMYFLAFMSVHITAIGVFFPFIAFLIFCILMPFLWMSAIYIMMYNYCKQEGINWPYTQGNPVLIDVHLTPFYYLNDYDPFIDYFDYDPRY